MMGPASAAFVSP